MTEGAVAMSSRLNSRVSRSWMISRCRRPRKPQRKPKPSAADELHLVGEAGVVEAQPPHRGAQILELRRVDREQAAEHHRLRRLEARQRRRGAPPRPGDGVADAGVRHLLDLRRDVADLARPEAVGVLHLGPEDADAVDLVIGVRAHHGDLGAGLERAVDDPHQHDDAEIGVVPAVDEERLQGRRGVALRGRQAMDDRLEHGLDVEPGLCRDRHRLRGVDADHLLDLLLDALGLGRRQVDLVQDRHDLVAGVDRVVDVGERLRLDALRGVDDEERALASRKRARHLVGEVDVPRRVHEVEDVGFSVLRPVLEPHRLGLDGDAALALDVHRIEHLLDHVALRDRAGRLDQPVGERRLAVVDVSDDREVADMVDRVGGHEGPVLGAVGGAVRTGIGEDAAEPARSAAMSGKRAREIAAGPALFQGRAAEIWRGDV